MWKYKVIEEIGNEYHAPTTEDENAEFLAHMEKTRRATLAEMDNLQIGQMEIDEINARQAGDASSILPEPVAPLKPAVPGMGGHGPGLFWSSTLRTPSISSQLSNSSRPWQPQPEPQPHPHPHTNLLSILKLTLLGPNTTTGPFIPHEQLKLRIICQGAVVRWFYYTANLFHAANSGMIWSIEKTHSLESDRKKA
ncbi:hypothetical protein AMTR_s00016p00154650 [Amborella trichopoda]|uniref:Uncharacterized protein n=1 Tax=Amborella trichopoda TaxID=13333 RepID=W1PEU0_AMBTC|nr:hypothetical protein AMTR_s00016p00154650 [Amborella trichopoda]